MRCGEKCFVVEMKIDGNSQTKEINARTPIEGRKKAKKAFADHAEIISVRKKSKR